MRNPLLCIPCILICSLGIQKVQAQDTFSIVAMDSVTGEVGSAGASCVNLIFFPGFETDFLGQLFPGLGAINSQAYYLEGNQDNAALRMEAGDTPQEIIDWLVANDIEGNPDIRQYGVVALVDGSPESAAHTGSSTDDYKGHRTGPNYSIQGNILLGPEILDSMEARFNREGGDLACKLMAAMQGANVIGADTRCSGYGTSSLFAFLKVAQAGDAADSPSLIVSVRTGSSAGIEPIDSLQTLFEAAHNCLVGTGVEQSDMKGPSLYPNPVTDYLFVHPELLRSGNWQILNQQGQILITGNVTDVPDGIWVYDLVPGIYWIRSDKWRTSFIKTETP